MTATESKTLIDELFEAGAHYAYSKSRRHPSAHPFIFGTKDRIDIFDLEHVVAALERAEAALEQLGKGGKQILFVSSKHEARKPVKEVAEKIGAPYVAGRWVGGTFTNFALIKKRVEHLEELMKEREEGTLSKYTKRERLLIDREIDKLDEMFGGLRGMKSLPAAIVVVDPKHEKNAVAEATLLNIPIFAVANSDCDLSTVDYPIPANDSNESSIAALLGKLGAAYTRGKKEAPEKPAPASA